MAAVGAGGPSHMTAMPHEFFANERLKCRDQQTNGISFHTESEA